MFFSIPWIYIVDISGFYLEEYMLGYLLLGHMKDAIQFKVVIREAHCDDTCKH
jgi:hypothetical protein